MKGDESKKAPEPERSGAFFDSFRRRKQDKGEDIPGLQGVPSPKGCMFEKTGAVEFAFSEFPGDPSLGVHFHLEPCVLFLQLFRFLEDLLLQFRLISLKATSHGRQGGNFLMKRFVEAKNHLTEKAIAEVGGRGVENHGEKCHGCIREGLLCRKEFRT